MVLKYYFVTVICLLTFVGCEFSFKIKNQNFEEGKVEYESGNYEKAINALNIAIAESPESSMYSYRGLCYFKIGDFDKSLMDFNRAILYDSTDPQNYANRSMLRQYLKNYKGALEDINKCIELDSGYFIGYLNRGAIFFKNRKYKHALDDFNKAINLNDKNPSSFYNRSLAKIYLNDYKGALQDLDTVIMLDPHDSIAIRKKASIISEIDSISLVK